MTNKIAARVRIDCIVFDLNLLKLIYSWKSSLVQLGNQQGARKFYTFGLKRLKAKFGIEEL